MARCPRCALSRFWLTHCPICPLATFGILISHNDMVVDEYDLDPVPCNHCTHLYCPRLTPFVRTCAHKCQYPQIQTQNGHLSCSHVLSDEALGGPLEVHNCAAHSQFGCVSVPLHDALWIQNLECCTSFSQESAQRHSQTQSPSFVHWTCWLSCLQVQSARHSCLQLHTPRSIGAHYCRNDMVLVCPSCESDLQMHTSFHWADHGTHFFMAGVHCMHVCIRDMIHGSLHFQREHSSLPVCSKELHLWSSEWLILSVHTVLQFDGFPDKRHSFLHVWLLSQQSCSRSWQHVLTASAHTYHGSPPQKKIDTNLAL